MKEIIVRGEGYEVLITELEFVKDELLRVHVYDENSATKIRLFDAAVRLTELIDNINPD